jgi:phenylacetate-CoA ligase
MLDAAARALGCVVIPAGTGQTELQVKVAVEVGATGYLGTPSFLHALLTKALEAGTPLRLEAAFVVAEMLPESLRTELEQSFGVRVLQGYGTADLGCLAYACPEKGGWHLHPEAIVEVLDLETGAQAVPGQPGEVVATVFDKAYPLIRFATGGPLQPGARRSLSVRTHRAQVDGAPGPGGRRGEGEGDVRPGGPDGRRDEAFPRGGVLPGDGDPRAAPGQSRIRRRAFGVGRPAGCLTRRIADALRDEVKVRGEVRIVLAGTISAGAKKLNDCRVWK